MCHRPLEFTFQNFVNVSPIVSNPGFVFQPRYVKCWNTVLCYVYRQVVFVLYPVEKFSKTPRYRSKPHWPWGWPFVRLIPLHILLKRERIIPGNHHTNNVDIEKQYSITTRLATSLGAPFLTLTSSNFSEYFKIKSHQRVYLCQVQICYSG